MAAFSFPRSTAVLPSFLRHRRKAGDAAPRAPLRAVTDLGAPWTAPVAAAPAPAPVEPVRPVSGVHQESILELLRRLERGLAERAEARQMDAAPEESGAHAADLDSALKTALDTLQRMARQQR